MDDILTPSTLTLQREQTLFVITLVISCLIWLVCVVTIFPIIGLAIGGFVMWFLHGLLIGRIKSEAVKLDANQTPGLSHVFSELCSRLNLVRVPDLYLMQSGGTLNAFATRFCARDFVVLYSDILEAYGADSGEIKFLLGHEIGHIRSKHIQKTVLLLPGLFLPLLGSAYNRACESSCDRYGAFASQDTAASVRAMMILSGGKQAGRNLLAEAFSNQHHTSRGFFVSFHELLSSYPTMTKRVSDLLDLQKGQKTAKPPRNPFAYLFGIFVPGARFGVIGILICFYVFFITLSSVALPLVERVKHKAEIEAKKAQEELDLRRGNEETESPEPATSPK